MQNTPRKQLWSERITDLIDGQDSCQEKLSWRQAGSCRRLLACQSQELLQAQVSVHHRDPEPES